MPQSTKTMVYAPEVIVRIVTKAGTLDVSEDIVSGRVTNRIDAASDFSLVLNNRFAKYTNKIGRMDRIVIFLKRIHWVQVFAGYVSVVPVVDLYPTTTTITGACTIKRLQNFYWAPTLPASREIMYQGGSIAVTPGERDSGIGNMILNVMSKAGAWKEETVHIQNLPERFLEFAKNVQRLNETPEQQQTDYLLKVAEILGIQIGSGLVNGNLPGVLNQSATSIAPGGPTVVFNVDQLVQQAYVVGIPSAQLATAAAIALAESGGETFVKGGPNSDGTFDYGLWQINDIHKNDSFVPNGNMQSMFDPGNNAKAMFVLSGGGTNWKAWSSFGNRSYLEHMTAAKEAVAKFDPSKITSSTLPKTTPNTTPGTTVNDAANSAANTSTGGYSVGEVQDILNAGFGVLGVPYAWGGGGKDGPSKGIHDGGVGDAHGDYNKIGFDCSGLMQYMIWQGTKKRIDIGGSTGEQWPSKLLGHGYEVQKAQIQPGDLIYYIGGGTNHVAMYIGQNKMIEAPQSGDVVKISNARFGGNFKGILRVKGVTISGTINIDPATSGATTPSTDTSAGTVGLGSNEPIAEALFRIQFLGNADASKNVLYDDQSLINTQPLFQTIKALCSAGMRSFMSAPNGDFVAFYPDPFGIMGKKPAITIEDVELINMSISQNDSELTTHVFAAYNPNRMDASVADTAWQSLTHASVGMEDKAVMQSLLNVSETSPELSPETFYGKFGVRPLAVKYGDIKDATLNYFQALYTFLQKWSDQFNSRIDLTFMPELYPGMRMKVASQGLTVYVKEVTHDFSFDSGFSTSAIINSPTTDAGMIPGLVLS